MTNLEEQLEQFREELENKNEEVQQLHMQLEIQRKEATTRLQELEQENKLYKVSVLQRSPELCSSNALLEKSQDTKFSLEHFTVQLVKY